MMKTELINGHLYKMRELGDIKTGDTVFINEEIPVTGIVYEAELIHIYGIMESREQVVHTGKVNSSLKTRVRDVDEGIIDSTKTRRV